MRMVGGEAKEVLVFVPVGGGAEGENDVDDQRAS